MYQVLQVSGHRTSPEQRSEMMDDKMINIYPGRDTVVCSGNELVTNKIKQMQKKVIKATSEPQISTSCIIKVTLSVMAMSQ